MSIARPALKRLILILLLLASFPAISPAQTVVSGHVKQPDTTAPANALVCFTLGNYKPNSPRVIGTGILVSQTNFCITPAADGSFSTSLYGNNLLTPTSTTWRVDFLFNGQQQSSSTYLIDHSPFNLDTETPLSVSTPAGPNQLVTQAFPFTQLTPATTWTIPHNFNDPNTITIATTSSGAQMFPDTTNCRTDPNNCILTFVTPTAGFAIAMHAGAINIATNQPNAIVANPIGAQVIGGGQTTTFTGPVIFSQPSTVNSLWTFNSGLSSAGPNTLNGGITASGPNTFGGGGTTAGSWTHSGPHTFNNQTSFSYSVANQPIAQFSGNATANNNCVQITNTAVSGHTWCIGEIFGVGLLSFRDNTQSGGPTWGFQLTGTGANGGFLTHANTANRFYTFPDFSGRPTINGPNGIQFAEVQPGATADVQINACISALPANGGTCDARGFGATTQTIAATVNVGTSTKTVTLLFDRTTRFNCTITNNTACFNKGAGSSIIGQGEVAIPNAGITFASNASISQALFDQQQNGGNFVGGYVEGLTFIPNATMTVLDAFISLQCPLQITSYRNISFGGPAPSGIALKIYGTTACGAGNVDFNNVQIDCQGSSGCRPIWIGCASAGSTTLVSCPGGIGNISFSGKGSSFGHPGSGGLPVFDIECGNGASGTNTCGGFSFSALQIESRNSGDIGILANGPESIHIYDLYASCAVTCGADLIRLAQPAGTVLDGVDIRGIDNQGGWTNTLNNTITGKTFTSAGSFARINYAYSAFNRLANFVDGGPVGYGGVTFANLGTPANGTYTYCSDCTIANPCAGSGTGAFAKRLNGIWVCN